MDTPKHIHSLVVDFEHDDTTKQEHLMTHITNLLNDLNGWPLDIEVAAYGPGVMLLVTNKSAFIHEIKQLQERGVQFRACRNAMNALELQDDDLLAGVEVVPSGVGRIIKAQLAGSAYFKA